jgi:hypothetical protein
MGQNRRWYQGQRSLDITDTPGNLSNAECVFPWRPTVQVEL